MKKILSLLFCALCFFRGNAQVPESVNAADILLRMKKLKVLGAVLYIAAHPDDENTRLLAWLSKDRLYRTGYLSLTRGDGGQNLIGEEQGVELGLIRTQELLAARRMDGAEQFFSRAFDFGFSKTTAEALSIWGKEKILSDVVWMIRKFQPDLIITRFPEDSRAGHGHHSASAVLTHEAFIAAADPSRFPEQFKYGVHPWQAKRLLWNTFNFGSTNTISEDQLKVDVGGYNPLTGKSYGEVAAESRSQHKSQGFGVARSRGAAFEYFTLIAGDNGKTDIMDGVNTSWEKMPAGKAIDDSINVLIRQYDASHPERSVRGLVHLYQFLSKEKDGYWKERKLKETQDLIEACSGIWLEATVRNAYAATGDGLPIDISIVNRAGADILVSSLKVNGLDSSLQLPLKPDINYTYSLHSLVNESQPISQPYWLKEPMAPGSFNVSDQTLIGDAQSKPAYTAYFQLVIEGQPFLCSRPVQYKFTDPVKGEVYQPLTILPVLTAVNDPELLLLGDNRPKEIHVNVEKRHSNDGTTLLGFTEVPGVHIKKETPSSPQVFTAMPVIAGTDVRKSFLYAGNQKRDSLFQLKTIAYDHIPRIDYFKPATVAFVLTDLKTIGKQIGYIEGAGDKVPVALQQMGYAVTFLNRNNINAEMLKHFDAIITGVRAYDVHDWLFEKYELLMQYVEEGGNLIVQYNRSGLGTAKTRIGPYPFSISGNRVTDEDAKVEFLQKDHAVLNHPNKITEKDFDGWIQERGIYFAGQSDPRYQQIFSMHDGDEPDQKGSLLVADYGKGKFVYTGLVFFRELPAGVPGAFRLLANIIALNHN